MVKSSTTKDAQALFHSLRSAYAATPTNLKIIDLYVMFAVFTALIQVVYMAIVGSFPFNSFLSGVLSCVGTAVLAVCLRIQVNKENKEFKHVHMVLLTNEAAQKEMDSADQGGLGQLHPSCGYCSYWSESTVSMR